ncbi:hypothetical protein U9M48_021213 [Paspalum notatum var. saurae]|uniref:GDSL esterase/lipase n=1 Tax=Paspalum notatum var. saurae TaxID=547442 RepID=A0AAQ3TGU9_PASNO
MMKLPGVLSLSVLLLTSVVPGAEPASSLPDDRRYDSIFSFGDSFADTGNDIVVFAENSLTNPVTRPPYGMTFFGHPTGRFSNGRLIIDFIAEELGLPLVPPVLAHNGSFQHGANFAVSGAFARNASFYRDIPIIGPLALNTSSSVQMQWFESLKPSLCSSPDPAGDGGRNAAASLLDCRAFFHKALFFMGEFGVNDYNFSLFGKNVSQIRLFVPDVVKTIAAAAERVIKHGAKTVVVPGIPPLGCQPPNLAMFPSSDPAGYDPRTGCLNQLNDLSVYHNSLLQEAIGDVQTKHRNVKVIYADFFTPIVQIVESPEKLGFTRDILRACCGGGGKYNFNISAGCGMPGSTVCQDPSAYLYWDGHFTEAAYRYIAAEALGLPLLPPSLATTNLQSFRQGVNFAVGGATALERAFSSPQECQEYFAQALFVVGELGWNDYAVMLLAGNMSVDEVEVVGNICAATEKLVNDGAKTVVVSGIPPLGCAPANLALFANQQTGGEHEPETGCLKHLNLLSKDHNLQLRRALARLDAGHPDARIAYADFYTPIDDFVTSPDPYGFSGRDGGAALEACCGGQYNFDLAALCGMPGVSALDPPSAYVTWDGVGVHLTEAANRLVADGWLTGPYAHPPILSTY